MERFPENASDLQTAKQEELYNHDCCCKKDNKEEEEEENGELALSLRDLPLNTTTQSTIATAVDHRDHQPAAEFFEFLSSTSDDLSPAENIIFNGKLVPLNHQNALRSSFSPRAGISGNENDGPRIRVRSESLSAIQGDKLSRSESVTRVSGIKLMRNSRSLDYRKLSRDSSNIVKSPQETTERKLTEKNSPARFTPRSDTASFGGKGVRPRWYVMMFGMVKFPPEIELRDMKSRQNRRNIPPVLFPSSSDRSSSERSSPPSSSWRFLKALSCKEPNSVAVTAPFWVPHAR